MPLQRKKQHKKMLKSGEMNVIGSIKEKLISSVNNVKKAETPQVKSNYAPDLLVENILLEIKTDCPVERSAPPPPQPLIDLCKLILVIIAKKNFRQPHIFHIF